MMPCLACERRVLLRTLLQTPFSPETPETPETRSQIVRIRAHNGRITGLFVSGKNQNTRDTRDTVYILTVAALEIVTDRMKNRPLAPVIGAGTRDRRAGTQDR